MTFSPHPRELLTPDTAPLMISPGVQQVELLGSMKLDGMLQLPFDHALARKTPEAFFEMLVTHIPGLAVILVGDNFRFGHRASGDVALLKALVATREGMSVFVAEEICAENDTVSSTRIRAAITEGNLVLAEELLGRCYSITGPVQGGKKLGRTMGFPTANVASQNALLPPPGIYALRVRVGDRLYSSAGYMSAEQPDLVEAHLLDFEGDLYGQEITVTFVQRIRAHKDFTDKAALQAAIADDVRAAREILR
jgi:riboflavin kinase/FMN adenylyltransferase